MHGEGAGERIKRLGRIGLVDGGDQSRFPAGAGFIFNHAGGGIKQRSFPGPRTAEFATEAHDAAINGGVDVIGARREIGETFVGDRDGGRRAGEARGAIGIGGAGRGPEARAERIVRIGRGHDDVAVGALGDAVGFAVGDGLGLIEAGVGERGDAVREVKFAASKNVRAIGLGLDDARGVVVPVVIGRHARATWSGGGKSRAAGAVGHEEEGAGSGSQRRGNAGRTRAGEGVDRAVSIGAAHGAEEVITILGRGGAQVEGGIGGNIPRRRCAVAVVGFRGERAVAGIHRFAAVEIGSDHRAAPAFGEL